MISKVVSTKFGARRSEGSLNKINLGRDPLDGNSLFEQQGRQINVGLAKVY